MIHKYKVWEKNGMWEMAEKRKKDTWTREKARKEKRLKEKGL